MFLHRFIRYKKYYEIEKKNDGTGIRTHLLCKIGKITVTRNKKFPKVANRGTHFQ